MKTEEIIARRNTPSAFTLDNEIAFCLERLKNVQKATSGAIEGAGKPTNENITAHAMGLMGETFELIQKLGWKYWKDNPEITPDLKKEIAEEFADILAFLGLITLHVCDRTGLTPSDLEAAYWNKTQKNLERFYGISGEEGYSGRSELDDGLWWDSPDQP